jgi:hypothetical protein
MSTIVTRSGKGTPLTNTEVDANFTNLNTDKAELSGATFTGEIVAPSLDISGNIDVDGVTNLDVVDIDGAVDMASTLIIGNSITQNGGDYLYSGGGNFDIKHTAAGQNIVFSTTPSGGSTAETLRITSDGKLSKLTGDLTLDVAGDIILDADGGDVIFKDGGALRGSLKAGTNAAFELKSLENNADFKIKGIDNNAEITALTLDMSNAGRAIFNAGASFADHVYLSDNAKLTLGNGDDGTLYSDGTNIIQTATGNLTLDVAGNIILDADGGYVLLKDAGVQYGGFYTSSSDLVMQSYVQDKDIIFYGNDGGSGITALSLDMSAAGEATFNDDINLSDGNRLRMGAGGDFEIFHDGSNNIFKGATSDQDMKFNGVDGGSEITALSLDMSAAGAATFNSTVTSTGLIVGNTNIGSNSSHLVNLTINNNGYIGTTYNSTAIQLSTVGAATFSSSVRGTQLEAYKTNHGGDVSVAANQVGNAYENLASTASLILGATATSTINSTKIVADHSAASGGATTNHVQDLVFYPVGGNSQNFEAMRISSLGALTVKNVANGHTVFNENGIDADFRVESDGNDHMLFVDGSSNFVTVGDSATFGGDFNVFGATGIRGKKASGYKNASMIRPTAFGYSVGTYAVTQIGDTNTQGTVSIGYDPSGNTNGSFSGTGIEMLFTPDIHFYQPNAADNAYVKQLRMVNTVGVTINDGGADLDFRVESNGNANMLFVDGGVNRVGLGTGTPSDTLDVRSGGIRLYDNADGNGGVISFGSSSGYQTIGGGSGSNNMNYRTYANHVFKTTTGSSSTTDGTERMSIGTGVVINETGVDADFRVESNANGYALFVDGGTDTVSIGTAATDAKFRVDASNADLRIGYASGYNYFDADVANVYRVGTSSVEAMKMDIGGIVLNEEGADRAFRVESNNLTHALYVNGATGSIGFGTSSTSIYGQTSGTGTLAFKADDGSTGGSLMVSNNADRGWSPIYLNKFAWASGDDSRFMQFYINAGDDTATLSYDGTNFAIVNPSDYRLKENVVAYTGGLAKINAIGVKSFNKIDGVSSHITQEGFIAHELKKVIPLSVIGEKDAMKTNESGEEVPDYQAVNKEALIPYLVSAIQEQQTLIESLTNRIAALEE